MKAPLTVTMLSLTVAEGVCLRADEPPAWAYAIAPAPAAGAQAAAPASSQKCRLDGSNLLVTRDSCHHLQYRIHSKLTAES
jgi:hypothetical protein